MVKIALLILFIFFILIFPVYENSKIVINVSNKHYNIPLVQINNGKFFVYDKNLSKKGNFSVLNIYRNFYKGSNLKVIDLIKEESYTAKSLFFKNDVLNLYNFHYNNDKYSLFSNYVIYNLKTKNVKGKKFLLFSNEYNASGKDFFVDSNRNIKADFISFYLKVKK